MQRGRYVVQRTRSIASCNGNGLWSRDRLRVCVSQFDTLFMIIILLSFRVIVFHVRCDANLLREIFFILRGVAFDQD